VQGSSATLQGSSGAQVVEGHAEMGFRRVMVHFVVTRLQQESQLIQATPSGCSTETKTIAFAQPKEQYLYDTIWRNLQGSRCAQQDQPGWLNKRPDPMRMNQKDHVPMIPERP
jgi:hypothetical protein